MKVTKLGLLIFLILMLCLCMPALGTTFPQNLTTYDSGGCIFPVVVQTSIPSLMRKRYRDKKGSSCALCKPHKRGHAVRFTTRELQERKRAEAAILDAKRKDKK